MHQANETDKHELLMPAIAKIIYPLPNEWVSGELFVFNSSDLVVVFLFLLSFLNYYISSQSLGAVLAAAVYHFDLSNSRFGVTRNYSRFA